MRELLQAQDPFANFRNEYETFYGAPYENTLHKLIADSTTFEILSPRPEYFDRTKFTGPAWCVLPKRDYSDFLLYKTFMYNDMGNYWFMNAWASPKEALCFRAYGEASCHELPPAQQYVLMCLHIEKERFIKDSEIKNRPKTSFFQ